jgi:hypothetical protein
MARYTMGTEVQSCGPFDYASGHISCWDELAVGAGSFLFSRMKEPVE